MLKHSDSAFERATALDPNLTSAAGELITNRVDEGETGNAYAEASALVKRRPQSAIAHFVLGYVLRYAGSLEDAARECDTALTLDRGNYQFRSCVWVFVQLNQQQRAMDFVRLDAGSEWAKEPTAHILLRQGKLPEARQSIENTAANVLIGRDLLQADLLQACREPSKTPTLEKIAHEMEAAALADGDAEVRYLAGTTLAYCGQNDAALRLLKSAVEHNYCSYTALQTDPLLVKLRGTPEFSGLLSAAKQCQNRFLAQRDQNPQ
ncbi:MAG: hypothetical protein DMG76_35740 [Acidobacteria bacterium]|nr:MAG: hypothetical protein DMG76_35740 [Acidobacteriota bacterium]